MNERKVKKIFKNKVVLITGGTGSLGQKLVERILPFKPKEIRIFSRSEKLQYEMRQKYPMCKYIPGGVEIVHLVRKAVSGSDIILHLAACKHIPVAEEHPTAAIFDNVVGSINVINAALDENVEKFLAISTDKAVDPLNTYGMTKKLLENLMLEANRCKGRLRTLFSTVRYGNVIGTTGSVIPLWKKQLDEGKPITLTDGTMTRFLFTLDEAVDLIFYALVKGKGGEIFSVKMRAAYLGTVANVMAKKGKVKIIGPRPGEKKHEIIISAYESKDVKEDGKYLIIKPGSNCNPENAEKPSYSNEADILGMDEIEELLRIEGWVDG